MLFFTNGESLNMILLIFITLLLVIIYSKYIKEYKKILRIDLKLVYI